MASPPDAPPPPQAARRWRLLSRLKLFLRRPGRASAQLALAAVALGTAVVVVDFLLGRAVGFLGRIAAPTGGLISIESPEVYTRERLLNDRLDHAAWLEQQLDEMRGREFMEKFRSIDGLHTAEVYRRIGAKVPPGERPRLEELRPTTLSVFRAMNEYREALRAERTQLMLDDRHDADGNTLYLLSFDTTILRARGESRLGLVLLRLSAPDVPQASHPQDDPWNQDLRHIYDDWVNHLNEALEESVAAAAALIRAPQMATADEALLMRALAQRACEALMRGRDSTAPSKNEHPVCRRVRKLMGDHTMGDHTEALARTPAPQSDREAQLFLAWIEQLYQEANTELRSVVTQELSSKRSEIGSLLALFGIERSILDVIARGPTERMSWWEGLFEMCSFTPSANYEPLTRAELRRIEIANAGYPRPEFAVPRVPCPPNGRQLRAALLLGLEEWFQLNRDSADWFRAVLERIASEDVRLADPPAPSVLQPAQVPFMPAAAPVGKGAVIARIRACFDLLPAAGRTRDLDVFCRGFAPIQAYWNAYDRLNRCAAMAFQSERLKPAFERLPKYKTMPYTGDRRVVSLEPVTLPVAPWCRLVAQPAPDKAKAAAAKALWDRLEKGVDPFAYALVPRKQVQRVRSSGRLEEAFEAASAWVQGQITDGFGVADTRASGWAGESERVVAIAFGTPSRPRVPPSGGGRSCHPTCGTETSQDNSVVFGWLFEPRTGSDEPDAALRAEHLKLQAAVSVPSWWRAAVLQEVTCWVRPETLGSVLHRVRSSPPGPGSDLWRAVVEKKLLQDCQSRPSIVRLPGTVTEISPRLGIDVVKRPHIKTSPLALAAREASHTLMVGQPARLVIEGGRLWRNTVVTVGAQRADRIFVLPNMRGIVAEFRCLEPPLLARPPNETERYRYGLQEDRDPRNVNHPDHGAVLAQVQVWTSEGRAEIPGGVLVRQFSKDNIRGRDKPCQPLGSAQTHGPPARSLADTAGSPP